MAVTYSCGSLFLLNVANEVGLKLSWPRAPQIFGKKGSGSNTYTLSYSHLSHWCFYKFWMLACIVYFWWRNSSMVACISAKISWSPLLNVTITDTIVEQQLDQSRIFFWNGVWYKSQFYRISQRYQFYWRWIMLMLLCF